MESKAIQSIDGYVDDIRSIIYAARNKTYSAVNAAMCEAYWHIGKRIVEEEQQGKHRADYGKEIIKKLSQALTQEFGGGFGERNLRDFRQFYLTFQGGEIWHAARAKLTWTHFRSLMRVADEEARQYYLTEAVEQHWTARTLDRNISTLYYQRLLSSQKKNLVTAEMLEKTADLQNTKLDFIKNPAVLEFLGLPNNGTYLEDGLEEAIIGHLQQFLLELGKGFAFVSRQQLIRTETAEFYIDLVFYNFILKCFVLVELKTGKMTHQDIGQLDMYVRMFDDIQKCEGDNPTIGILLCTETDRTIAKYSVLSDSQQLFATKFMPYLPTEEELIAEIERQKHLLKEKSD